MTTATSRYPTPVDELIPAAQDWAAGLDRPPSRNAIMTRFKVGADKANQIRAALQTTPNPDPAPAPDPGPALGPGRSPDPVTGPGPVGSGEQTVPLTDPGLDLDSPLGLPVVRPERDGDVTDTPESQVKVVADLGPARVRRWPIVVLALPAFVAIWGGWVGLGKLTGFGPIQLLPGIWDGLVINSAITLPIGVEAYAALALHVWLSGRTRSHRARRFAKWSALASLGLGMAGQVAYHLMVAAGVTVAPWQITTFVSCLPVVVLGCGAALLHLNSGPREVT